MYEQRREDHREHRGEDKQQLACFLEEVLLHEIAAEEDGEGEYDRAYQQRHAEPPLPEGGSLERLDEFCKDEHHEHAQQGSQYKVAQHVEYESGDYGAAPFALHRGGIAAEGSVVFVFGLLDRPLYVAFGGPQHPDVTVLPLYDAPLEGFVAVLGVVVILLQAVVGLGVVLVVAADALAAVFVHGQKGFRTRHAGVAVNPCRGVEEDGLVHAGGVGLVTEYEALGLGGGGKAPSAAPDRALHAEAVGGNGYAVGNDLFFLKDRGNTPQGLYEPLVAVYLHVCAFDDLVVGHLPLVEALVFAGGLAQGVGDIEGEVLVLGVKYERVFVAALYHLHHPVVLDVVALAHP